MFRFLHAADLHLDSPLRGLSRYEGCPADEIRRASRRAMENLVALAIEEKVAFVLIAGDLYDGNLSDYGACLFLNEQMLRLRDVGIHVFIIQGNHDAASIQTKYLRLPDNVHRHSTDRPESFRLDAYDVAVHGQGFGTRSVTEKLALAYPDPIAGTFNVGLLHTSLTGREGHETYAPCTVEELRSKRYDYWALGHVHQAETLHNDPPIVFPGNLQGRHIREIGAKGAQLVTVNQGRVVEQEHRSLDVMRWSVCVVDAKGAVDEDELLERSRDRLLSLIDESEGRPMIARLEIRGACLAHDRMGGNTRRISAEILREARDVGGGRIWIEKVSVKTRPEMRNDALDGPIRAVRDYLDRLANDPTRLLELGRKELADLKKKLPGTWSDGAARPPIDSIENLMEALHQVGPELLVGLSGSGGEMGL